MDYCTSRVPTSSIMASHVPGFRDYVFHSHAGKLATHTDLSVMIVR